MMKPERVASLLLLLAVVHVPAVATAETTAWSDNDGGRMRVVALPPDANGSVRAVIEIVPKSGWITYWREPGDSGIPAQVTVSGGAALSALAYPVPKVLTLGTLKDVGYDHPVGLPLTLQAVTGPAKVDVFIGLCKDICIPFQASFPLGLAVTAAKPEEVARVDAADGALPAAASSDFNVAKAGVEGRALVLDLTLPAGTDSVSALLIGPPGFVFPAEAKAARAGATRLTVTLDALDPSRDIKSVTWTVLLNAGGRAIETPVVLP